MIQTPLQRELAYYSPALSLDSLFPRSLRRATTHILVLLFLLLVFLRAVAFVIPYIQGGILSGLILIIISVWFTLFAFESFYNTWYFKGSGPLIVEVSESIESTRGVTFEVAAIIRRREEDVMRGFLESVWGRDVVARVNISDEALATFLEAKRTVFTVRDIVPPENGFLSLSGLVLFLFKNDPVFADFLFQNGVTEELYRGAVIFTERIVLREKYARRWWNTRRLEGIMPIGADWSYGGAWLLERFGRSARSTSVFSGLAVVSEDSYTKGYLHELTTILSRAKEANAILIGEEGVGKRDILVALAHAIQNEMVPPELLDKRVLVLDDDAFIAIFNTKALFEQNMIKMLSQAEKAGNIILALVDFPGFINSAEALGADVGSLLDPYLASSDLHVVATANPVSFHSIVETNPQLLQRFEQLRVESPDASGVIAVVEDVVSEYERKHNVLFTYQALHAVATNADRYVPGGVMPDKAVDLLVEIIPSAAQNGVHIITKEFIDQYVKEKTGIPIGTVTGEEREVLLNLESILHTRVIGQDEAIDQIANAMRRARAGIQNPKRPLGSFLFLGPTGVGKTETTKALAEVFFGDENNLLRLDMSEYNSEGALERLIGGSASAEGGPGDLSVILKEHPYGVLLLDEFEKTTPEVKDLFLQILDEGIFTNVRSERISARNTVIIATSNAGSDLIWEYGKSGKPLAERKDEIVDTLVKKGIFKPELVNRFDGVVLFHVLAKEHLTGIARIMLERLKKRIHAEGYDLVVNDILINLLITEGFNPQFGARPMQRVVQDRIEKLIAEKILEGSLKPGSSIEFTESDFI